MKPFCELQKHFWSALSVTSSPLFFPSSSPNLSPLPHHFSHLPLTPPHSLQCLCSDSYVLVERGLLLICAEWKKAVLAWGEKSLV